MREISDTEIMGVLGALLLVFLFVLTLRGCKYDHEAYMECIKSRAPAECQGVRH